MLRWKKARPSSGASDVPSLTEHEIGDIPGFTNQPQDTAPDILFHRAGSDWEAFVDKSDGSRLQILVEDVDGQPNPEFVPKIAGILGELDSLESKARISQAELASRLTSEHQLNLICETHPKAEFALGFAARTETAIVDFQDGEVYSWCFLQDPADEMSAAR
jgi:hypothetical protein